MGGEIDADISGKTTDVYVGLIIGNLSGTIENVYVLGSLTSTSTRTSYVGGMVGYYSCDEESAKGMYFQHISVSSENICYPLCGNHSKVYCLKPRFLDITYNGLKWY